MRWRLTYRPHLIEQHAQPPPRSLPGSLGTSKSTTDDDKIVWLQIMHSSPKKC